MVEIKSSLDWASAEAELKKLGSMMPMFKTDIQKISKHISESVNELSKLEVTARNSHRRSDIERCNLKVAAINEELKKVQSYHLMALLSNSV